VGVDRTSVSSYDNLPPGKQSIVLTFKYDDGGGIGKGGLATLSVDGEESGRTETCANYSVPRFRR
jgi:arylsulfatase